MDENVEIKNNLLVKSDKELKQIISESSKISSQFEAQNFSRKAHGKEPLLASGELTKQQNIASIATHLINDRQDEREAYQVRPSYI